MTHFSSSSQDVLLDCLKPARHSLPSIWAQEKMIVLWTIDHPIGFPILGQGESCLHFSITLTFASVSRCLTETTRLSFRTCPFRFQLKSFSYFLLNEGLMSLMTLWNSSSLNHFILDLEILVPQSPIDHYAISHTFSVCDSRVLLHFE